MNNIESNKSNNLIIYQKYINLIYYTNDLVRKYPKSEMFALVQEIKNSLYSGLNCLVNAIKIFNKHNKLNYLNELDVNLVLLKIKVRISYKYKYISLQNYTVWSNNITEICNILGGWINSCQKK